MSQPWSITTTIAYLCRVSIGTQDYEHARDLFEKALVLSREVKSKRSIAYSLSGLAQVAMLEGNLERAKAFFSESFALERELGEKYTMSRDLVGLAWVATRSKQFERAARLLGISDHLSEMIGTHREKNLTGHYDKVVKEARAALGDDAYRKAWEEGRSMSLEEALEEEASSR